LKDRHGDSAGNLLRLLTDMNCFCAKSAHGKLKIEN
jgi:hypothetical protein